MKTIQMTIDPELLDDVDAAVKELGTNRSAFMRDALVDALRQLSIRRLEERHAAGYAAHPPEPGEFDGWEDEQVWADA
jgi:metal-responsive CopG/Arc/MetJ family transcriptional regulator